MAPPPSLEGLFKEFELPNTNVLHLVYYEDKVSMGGGALLQQHSQPAKHTHL